VQTVRTVLADGDIAGFLRDSYPGLAARLALRLGDRAVAEDAVQEALVRAREWSARREAIRAAPGAARSCR